MQKPPLKRRRLSLSSVSREESSRKWLRYVGLYSALGGQLVLSFLICVAGGNFLDEKLATRPLFLLVGVSLGMVANGYLLYRLVLLEKKTTQQKNN